MNTFKKEECENCKDLPEGQVVKGHDHRTLSKNLERIILPWSWGWSATIKWKNGIGRVVNVIENENGFVVMLNNDVFPGIIVSRKEATWVEGVELIENVEITGYVYAGQLAGNDPVPEGQKFFDKILCNILKAEGGEFSDNEIRLIDSNGRLDVYFKSDVAPYFE